MSFAYIENDIPEIMSVSYETGVQTATLVGPPVQITAQKIGNALTIRYSEFSVVTFGGGPMVFIPLLVYLPEEMAPSVEVEVAAGRQEYGGLLTHPGFMRVLTSGKLLLEISGNAQWAANTPVTFPAGCATILI